MQASFHIGSDTANRMLLNLAGIPQDIVDRVLEPEARLHAQELVRLTFPRKAAQGKSKIARSVRRMFLTPASESLAHFSNKKIQDRISALRGNGSNQALSQVLKNVWKQSSHGSALPLVEASRAGMESRRTYDAKWRGHARGGRSISSEAAVKSTIRDLSKEVGGAKKGWIIPGVKAPGWVKAAIGPVGEHTNIRTHDKTEISVTNNESAMAAIEQRTGIAAFVVKLRARKVTAKINFEVRRRVAGS